MLNTNSKPHTLSLLGRSCKSSNTSAHSSSWASQMPYPTLRTFLCRPLSRQYPWLWNVSGSYHIWVKRFQLRLVKSGSRLSRSFSGSHICPMSCSCWLSMWLPAYSAHPDEIKHYKSTKHSTVFRFWCTGRTTPHFSALWWRVCPVETGADSTFIKYIRAHAPQSMTQETVHMKI